MADWEFDGKIVKETKFQERTLKSKSADASLYATRAEAKQFLGEDTFASKLQKTKLETGQIFSEKFGEEIPENAEMERKIQDNYRNLKGSTVTFLTIGKRAGEAKEKIRLKKHLAAEQQKLIERRRSDMETVEDRLLKSDIEKGNKDFATEKEKEAFRQWARYKRSDVEEDRIAPELLQKNFVFRDNAYKDILKELNNTTIEEFKNKDEADFASGFAYKYEKICRMACADVFLEKFRSISGTNSINLPIAELRAKIAFFKELKTQYEDRYKLLSSPYYALLRRSDMKEYLGKSGEAKVEAITDQKLKTYVLLYRNTMSSPLAMGNRLSKRFNELVKDYKGKQCDEDVEKVAPLLLEAEETLSHLKEAEEEPMLVPEREARIYENLDDEEESMRLQVQIFRSRKAELKKSFPEDDVAFLRNYDTAGVDDKVLGLTGPDLAEVEKIFLEILEKKSVNGVKLSEAVLAEVSAHLKDYVNLRREYQAALKATDDATKLASGMGADLQNQVFRNTDVGKKLMRYVTDDYSPRFSEYTSNLGNFEYGRALVMVLTVLHKHNISCFPQYENRVVERADEALEKMRELREEDDKKPFQYPHVTVNGTKITLYSAEREGFIHTLAGKSFTLPGEKGKELLSLMKQYAEAIRKSTISKSLFGADDGIKGIVGMMYNDVQAPVIRELQNKIGELLK